MMMGGGGDSQTIPLHRNTNQPTDKKAAFGIKHKDVDVVEVHLGVNNGVVDELADFDEAHCSGGNSSKCSALL